MLTVANSFSVPNTSRDNDDVVIVPVVSEPVTESSESVLVCIHS